MNVKTTHNTNSALLGMLPSHKANTRQRDYEQRQAAAKASADATNRQRKADREREEARTQAIIDDAKALLVSGNCEARDIPTVVALSLGFDSLTDHENAVHERFQQELKTEQCRLQREYHLKEEQFFQELYTINK